MWENQSVASLKSAFTFDNKHTRSGEPSRGGCPSRQSAQRAGGLLNGATALLRRNSANIGPQAYTRRYSKVTASLFGPYIVQAEPFPLAARPLPFAKHPQALFTFFSG
jgi:hypothetical protein